MKTKDKIGIILVLLLIYLITLPKPVFEPFLSSERIAELEQMTPIEYIARIDELLDKYATSITEDEFSELAYLQEHPQSAEIQNQIDPGAR